VKRSVIFGAMLAVCGLASVHAQTYTFTDLGHASGVTSAAANINNLGQVVGLVKDANGWNHAVTWVEGQAVHLGLASGDWGDGGGGFTNPWGMYGEAIGINDAGQIAWTNTDLNKVRYATVWANGVATDLGTLGGAQSDARGINQAGLVVGRAQDANGNWRAVTWNGVQASELNTPNASSSSQANAVNNAGQIVGYEERPSQPYVAHPVIWDQGVATNLDESLGRSYEPRAHGLNDVGQIVGSLRAPSTGDYYRAVLWDHGVSSLLDMPSDFHAAEAKDINNAGQIVGFMLANDVNVGFRAATWINGQVIDLNSLLPASVVDAGWVLLGANAINEVGQIVGQARNTQTGVIDAFVLTPVPESGTWAMMLLGLGAMAIHARLRSSGKSRA
jgi:probable HAF family extracellular repeat protein